jgi:beta-glucosidase
MPRHFVVLTLLRTALSAPCLGEYSKCPSGACALIATGPFSQCAQCAAGAYACPLSTTACFTDAASYAACPGLAGTHFDSTLSLDARVDYMFKAPWSVAEFIGQMTDNATSLSRLSIPNYSWLNDDQHGVKQPDATAFPNGGAMGASYSTELLRRVGLAIGTEARGVHNTLDDKSGETGGHSWPGTIQNGVGLTMYAPNVNLVHEPRWGRANEVMSECPHLSGSLVAAYVQGLQNATPAAPVGTAGPLLAVA